MVIAGGDAVQEGNEFRESDESQYDRAGREVRIAEFSVKEREHARFEHPYERNDRGRIGEYDRYGEGEERNRNGQNAVHAVFHACREASELIQRNRGGHAHERYGIRGRNRGNGQVDVPERYHRTGSSRKTTGLFRYRRFPLRRTARLPPSKARGRPGGCLG